jgi:hypothetical protein
MIGESFKEKINDKNDGTIRTIDKLEKNYLKYGKNCKAMMRIFLHKKMKNFLYRSIVLIVDFL